MANKQHKTWCSEPRQGNPRLIWLYMVGRYGIIRSMETRYNGEVYVVNLPGVCTSISTEALRHLKVIP